MSQSAFGQVEFAKRLPEGSWSVESLIRDRLPGLDELIDKVYLEQVTLVSQIATHLRLHESIRLLFNIAVSDFQDLLLELRSGSGRSAMRTARSLIEHAINLRTIVDNPAYEVQYLDHLGRGSILMRDIAPGIVTLKGKEKEKYRTALERAGKKADRAFGHALKKYGNRFKAGWATRSLKELADDAGMEELYEYYRLASLIAHGSASGAIGLRKTTPAGHLTFRTGAAIELAPVAMWAGLLSYKSILSSLQVAVPEILMPAYSTALDSFQSFWPNYFKVVQRIDRDLWPTQDPPRPMALVAFTHTKKRRWYLHLPSYGVLIPAQDPQLSGSEEAEVTRLIEYAVTRDAHLFRSDQRWLSAVHVNIYVTIDPDASPIPESAIMERLPKGHTWGPIHSL